MTMGRITKPLIVAALGLALGAGTASAAGEVNIYTGRHYEGDRALYQGFEQATGIKVNFIEANSDELRQRLEAEGAASPADIFMTVDAGNLWRAEEKGLFQSVSSPVLSERIPENLRHPDGLWFGFSTRARLIFVAKGRVDQGAIKTYDDLADAKWRGKVCIRSSSNIYNLSLLGAMIENEGEAATEAFAKGVVANFAREPQGGDTDQLKAVAAGECDIALANSYYYLRLLRSDKPEDQAVANALEVVFPDQEGAGAHVNITGAGVTANAPHKANAIRFLEYLASDEAQAYFANGNNEFPVVAGVPNGAAEALGSFKIDPVNVAAYGRNQPLAQALVDRAGWK
ncbi:MAG: extracellular solute-binding protein [Alphaproteobacteria bacterium]|nr:extracellular solute-binding protein [Alphaproteobacteria bacterium]